MGNQQDIMNEFAMQDLKRFYSSYDGWKVSSRKQGSGYDSVVRLERMNGGHRDIAKVLITFNKQISETMVDELNVRDAVNDGMIPRYDRAVIAPANADTAALPRDLKVHTMRSFVFEGKDLVWVKKPVRKEQAS
jgi:transcriptional regulator CtsR